MGSRTASAAPAARGTAEVGGTRFVCGRGVGTWRQDTPTNKYVMDFNGFPVEGKWKTRSGW